MIAFVAALTLGVIDVGLVRFRFHHP